MHAGTFEIDFSSLGFELTTHDALGWSVGADSMRAVLNPAVDRGRVEMQGVLGDDAIVGRWRYVSDPGGATGTFELRRRRTGPVRQDRIKSLESRISNHEPFRDQPTLSRDDVRHRIHVRR